MNALQPVSFVYNQGDGRTRYGFIAEDTAAVDAHLATYDASSTVSGIDDRSIIAILVGAVQDLANKIAGFAEHFVTKELIATNGTFTTVTAPTTITDKLCLGSRCMTTEQFNHILDMEAAAGNAPAAGNQGAAGGPSAQELTGADTASTTMPASLVVNGNNPVTWQENEPWQDKLGAQLTLNGENETVYSTSTVDTTHSGTTTIDYWALIPSSGHYLHTTRDIVVHGAANDNVPPTATEPSSADTPAEPVINNDAANDNSLLAPPSATSTE